MTDTDRFSPRLNKASCWCGQLSAVCIGEPIRVSVCHCLSCKKRSGSAFAVQVRFPAEQVTISGESTSYVHIAESGNAASFHSCPVCSATLWYQSRPHFDAIAIPLGNFEDPFWATPVFSVYENRVLDWVDIIGDGIVRD